MRCSSSRISHHDIVYPRAACFSGVRAAAIALLLLLPTAMAILPPTPCPVGSCDIANASMEDCPGCASESGDMPLSWQPYTFPGQCFGEGVSWSSATARTGAASLRIVDTSTRCTGAVSEPVAIVPGLAYEVEMWAKAIEGAPQIGVFIAYYMSADAPYLEYVTKIPFSGKPGADWTRIGGATQQVNGATYARLWVYAPMGATGTTYVDDLSLQADRPSVGP